MKVVNLLKMIAEMLEHDVEFEFQNDKKKSHYEITPYSFNPKIGKKLAPQYHVDLGQGLLRLIEEQFKNNHPELHDIHGFLIKE
jgi:UDP-glucose 4-epimerase